MFIIDFDTDSYRAFAHGFLKGLAAPVALYHTERLPRVQVHYVQPSTAKNATEAVRTDWCKIGKDLQNVIDNEQTRKHIALSEAQTK